jgi:tripartite ATP-independent transporter DctM subunit
MSALPFLILILGMVLVLFTGIPVVFGLGAVATLTTFLLWGENGLYMIANSAFSNFTAETYVAIPMFLLMGNMLQKSGIADDLYEMLYKWMGGLRGGLAMGTVVICAIFGAMCGGSGPATITMGLIALPSMVKRGYDEKLAIGAIAAGGVLGIIIPPSIPMIIIAGFGQLSVSKLFMAGVIPGILCAVIYIIYIAIACAIDPKKGPALPLEERASMKEKVHSLWAMIGPVALIILVLGSIYLGIATPTEASAVGAMGTIVITILKKKISFKVLTDALKRTLSLICMVLWILIGAGAFNTIYNFMGAYDLIADVANNLPGGKWAVLAIMLLLNFFLGMLMDDYAIITLTAPLYLPIIVSFGFDPMWFTLIFLLNIQMAYLTPPFGFNLFYLKSITPKEMKITTIYKGVVPFIALQVIALVLCIIFPQLVMWLPGSSM